ncbi:MAG: hypothetical protein WCL14_11165 [Bacteroidota bacterium]
MNTPTFLKNRASSCSNNTYCLKYIPRYAKNRTSCPNNRPYLPKNTQRCIKNRPIGSPLSINENSFIC